MTLVVLAAVLAVAPLASLVPLPPAVRAALAEHRRQQERWVTRHDLSGLETLRAMRAQ